MASVLDLPKEPTSGLQTLAIFIVFFFPALALVVIILRAVGRLATRQFGLDDWLISIAMFLSLAETVVSYFFIKTNYIGIRIENVPPHDPIPGRIWNYGVQILYNPILALVKSSVLIFLLRLFGQKDGVRRFIYCLNAANMMQMVGVFFAITFQCTPIPFTWDPTIRGGTCVDQRVLFTTTAAFNIMTDLLVLGLPLWIFVDLKIPRKTKIALLFVFLLGFLVTITSIVRLVILVQGLFGLIQQPDPTVSIGFVTSAIETNLALITASAPALRPLLRTRGRGGWLPSMTFGASPDVEMGYNYSDSSTGTTGTTNTTTRGGKVGRGGSTRGGRGGKTGGGGGGGKRGGRRGRGGKRPVALRDIRIQRDKDGEQQLRSQSPRSSEEETMTVNGIMRVSDVQREIDGMVKEIAITGGGGYAVGIASTTTAAVAAAAAPDPHQHPRAALSRPAHGPRFYSEGVYPQAEAEAGADADADVDTPDYQTYQNYQHYQNYRDYRDYGEERMSKYGDRRFGVITPRTPKEPPPGRPF